MGLAVEISVACDLCGRAETEFSSGYPYPNVGNSVMNMGFMRCNKNGRIGTDDADIFMCHRCRKAYEEADAALRHSFFGKASGAE